jgi:hypothetical protein
LTAAWDAIGIVPQMSESLFRASFSILGPRCNDDFSDFAYRTSGQP